MCVCAGVYMRQCVCVGGGYRKKREYSQIAPRAASNRALTPRLAVGEKRGWAEERKREREGGRDRGGSVCV